MPANKKGAAPMSAEHKAALAAGRQQGITVRKYLEALEAHKPKRGRKRTTESIEKQLKSIEAKLADADALTRLSLVQQRMDLVGELGSLQAGVDLSGLETDFVSVAKEYSKNKGISYAAWREVGVEPAVLKRAGVTRSTR
ncbi:MAG: hypothetical protein EHM63_05495 [Actinobacteria bacterium]|nr:MAG: hypothetical protein EHM63_05495 [Actinomycetota bacterium]